MADHLPYFSQRQGRSPLSEELPFAEFRSLLVAILEELRKRGYFQEAFGYECVDGDKAGAVSDPAAYFFLAIRRRGVWPYWTQTFWEDGIEFEVDAPWESWDADTLFDVVEVLHDNSAKPLSGRHHSFNDCGYHADRFSRPDGRRDYVERVNVVLKLHSPPYELNSDGRIVERSPDEFRGLVSAGLPSISESESIEIKVEHAKHVFAARGATIESKRDAVKALAGCLERLKATVNKSMLSSDESALFDIANNFHVRHDNRKQKVAYDEDVWLRWMFYVYLATVHAVVRVRARQSAAS